MLFNSAFSYYYHTNEHDQKHKFILSSDAWGYYQYLTAVFYEKDVTNQPYSIRSEKGILLNKYNYGVALLELPFFLPPYFIAKFFKYQLKDTHQYLQL